MAVSTIFSPPRRKRFSPTLRVVILLLALALLLFLAADVWFFRAAKASLPAVDGTLKLSGLTAPVIVTRDSLGVPNISAENLHDLFFAQGFVTAQDRLWQMDMTRRYASGDLAVILGPEYIKTDEEQRILGLRQVAEKTVANMPADERARMQAYADGVNAYIARHQKTLPLEFRLMTYFPYDWTVEDSVMVGLSMTEFLNHYEYKKELQREEILARLGPQLTADLYVNSSWRDHVPGEEGQSIENEPRAGESPDQEEEEAPASARPKKRSSLEQLQIPLGLKPARDDNRVVGHGAPEGAPLQNTSIAPLQNASTAPLPFTYSSDTDSGDLRPGSNNWVVSGTHTVTGKPMLSNDMHLDLRMPDTWYEAHLTAGDYDVVGVTLPGVPYVIVGHNQRVAWGFTNLGPNVEDLYVEKFNDRGEYLTPQGWEQPERRKEIIRVKGKPDVNLDVVITRHGPIITPIITGETRQLALKWTIYDTSAGNVSFFDVDSARDWVEFRAAFSKFTAPGQNVVYADTDGNIGYQATGRVPIRVGDGMLPVSGEDDSHEWTGYVPYDKMPSVYDPPSGIIATANARVTPKDYPYTLAIEWSAPYRVQRIYKLLGAKKQLTAADMLTIQTDVLSEFDRFCAQRFVYAIDHTPGASRRAKAAADLLRNWDGTMATDLAAPTIAYYSRATLEELLLKAKLGDDWKTYHWFMKPVWLENIVMNQPPRWLPSQYADYNALLTAAVEAALSQEHAPTALSTWKWGRVHMVDVRHPFWSNFPVLKRATPGPQPLSGDDETIKQVSTHFGPSERFTADMLDLDHSTLDIVNGQSGDIFSEHFNDQWDAYYHGRTFPLPFSSQAVQGAGVHHLRLEPQ
ncbi:MAG: penicillin acylase family protein [Candidatus Korobacteraceae bacterium]